MPAAWAWGSRLPQAFLEAAAPGYLTDTEWDALGEDWLEQALAYVAVPCKGVRGPLTRIRPRPARSRAADPGSRDSAELAGAQVGVAGMPVYRLADYLDQHGRQHRKGQFPPADFWAAAAGHAFPHDQAALGDAAHDRGLYRDAAQLHKNAAARGNYHAVFYLSSPPRYFRADDRPPRWAAAHVALDDPEAVARLLGSLRAAGANEQAAALAERASELGRWDEAAAASREAADTRRRLAEASPEAYLPELAMSLNSLGIALSGAGRADEVGAVAEEAVQLYRQLAAAGALNNLGNRMSDAGRGVRC